MALTVKEASEYLKSKGKKIAPGTLSNLRFRGMGPAYMKVRGSVRYRKEDLDLWLAEKATQYGFSFRQYLTGQALAGLLAANEYNSDYAIKLAIEIAKNAEKKYIEELAND